MSSAASVLALLLLQAAPDAPPGAGTMERARVVAAVDPRIELLATVQLLAGYERTGLLTRHAVAYKSEVREWFEPFREHAAARLFAELWPTGFAFDTPVAVVLHLGPPPELAPRAEIGADLVARAGSPERLARFLDALRTFAQDTEFATFFAEQEAHFAALEADARARLAGVDAGLLEDYYGERRSAYRIVLAPLFHEGGFGPSVTLPDGGIEIYSVVGPSGAPDGRADFGTAEDFRYLVWHEFAHSFVNPLIAAEATRVAATETLYSELAERMRAQGYGTWLNVLQEHVVRAVTVRLAYRVQSPEAGRTALAEELGRGFEHVPALAHALERYEAERARYPSLAAFVLELFGPLEEVARALAVDPAKRAPAVVATLPAAGAVDVDVSCAELRIDFDQDMDTRSHAFLQDSSRPFPERTGEPRWTSARTCVLPVRLTPGTEYWVGLNAGGVVGFCGANGRTATPLELTFRTRR